MCFFYDVPSLFKKKKKNQNKKTQQKNWKNPPNTQLMNPQKQNTMLLK